MPAPPDRKTLRARRRALSATEQRDHACAISQRLQNDRLLRSAGRIACYLANDGEIITDRIIESAWSCGQEVYLPVLSPLGNSLYFALYTPHCKMTSNRYGIAEPAVHPQHWLKANQLDLLLMPLVAFDSDGNRMGMGAGYYDRTLSFMRHRTHRRRPFLLGVAHELQRVEALDSAPWDIPLHAVVTETGLQLF